MNRMRRELSLGAIAASISAPFAHAQPARLRVVVVGGGFAGTACARYLRLWAPQRVEVTLVEPKKVYVACPLSNRVLGGTFDLRDLARGYEALAAERVRVVHADAASIDAQRRSVVLTNRESLSYDRLVVAPGIDFDAQRIEGLPPLLESGAILHAWKGGPHQVWNLRNRIADLRAGGVVAVTIPKVPYRCPPGPYERISLIAHFLARNNPRAKLLAFDANQDVVAKRDLFQSVWKSRYAGIVEYVPNAELEAVRASELRFKLQGTVKADVINVIPPQHAPSLARRAGLVAGDWCPVDFRSYESTRVPGVHVLGDAIASAPGLPKSGHMANQSGKVCAAALAAIALGQNVPPEPLIANTCYSFVSSNEAIHVAGVYRYDPQKATMVPVSGAGGLSKAPNVAEAVHAIGWAQNILYDTFGTSFTVDAALT